MNSINELLISAHSIRHAMSDNLLSVFTLQLSTVLLTSHYEKVDFLLVCFSSIDTCIQEMKRLQQLFDQLNMDVYNPSGLNLLWPDRVAFLFVSYSQC